VSLPKLSRLQSLLALSLVVAGLLGVSLWAVNHAVTSAVESVTETANSSFTMSLVNSRWASLRPMPGLDPGTTDARKKPRPPVIDPGRAGSPVKPA